MGSRPYLLSTRDTLRKYGILDYEGYDFSMGRRNRRKYTEETMKKLMLEYLFRVIVPNAIIAKGRIPYSGRKEAVRDVLRALAYAMTDRRSAVDREAFKLMLAKEKDGWYFEKVVMPFHYYAFDLSYSRKKRKFADERMPGERRWDINRYVEEKMRGRRKRFVHSDTPALNELVSAYAADRSVAGYTTAQFKARFGCSNRTITKFKAYVREREAYGKDGCFLVMPRPKRRVKNGPGTAAKTGTS